MVMFLKKGEREDIFWLQFIVANHGEKNVAVYTRKYRIYSVFYL